MEHNYIHLLNSSGEEIDNPSLEPGNYSISYNDSNERWEIKEYNGPELNSGSLYYYYVYSSGDPTYTEITDLNQGLGLYFYEPDNWGDVPSFTKFEGLVYYYGSGGVEDVKTLELDSNYLYSYHGYGEFKRADTQLRDGVYYYVDSSGTPSFSDESAIGLTDDDGLYYWNGSNYFEYYTGLVYSGGSGSTPEEIYLTEDSVYVYEGSGYFNNVASELHDGYVYLYEADSSSGGLVQIAWDIDYGLYYYDANARSLEPFSYEVWDSKWYQYIESENRFSGGYDLNEGSLYECGSNGSEQTLTELNEGVYKYESDGSGSTYTAITLPQDSTTDTYFNFEGNVYSIHFEHSLE